MREVIKSINIRILVIYLGLFLLATGVSWGVFTLLGGDVVDVISPVGIGNKRDQIANAPKTEVCPLNGAKYSKQEREIWEKRRPLTVMVENHGEARPQSGLSRADVVYEAVAEGGITRFLAVFYCGAAEDDVIIGPVRSARVYFLDWAQEYSRFPLYAHVGGANRAGPADALGKIAELGWLSQGNDLNQFSIGFPTFWRDTERLKRPDGGQIATEHTMYASTDKLWELAEERGLTNKDTKGEEWAKNFVNWKFTEAQDGQPSTSIKFPFWEGQGDYNVNWVWDEANKFWRRENDGEPHTDLNNKEQLSAATVIVQFTTERALRDPEKHMLYGTTGSGDALVFRNGKVVKANWKKAEETGRTRFVDRSGKDIEFSAGKVWIEILPVGTDVSY